MTGSPADVTAAGRAQRGDVLAVITIRRVEDAVTLPLSAAVVVLDVIRATTTIAHALAAGAAAIVPVGEVDEARRERARRPASMLAGERDGLPPEGFDLGNSPGAMTAEVVGGKIVVMSTTNGTRAILAAGDCRRVLTGAIVNASAIAEALRDDPGPVVLLCAGSRAAPSVDDDLGAGAVADALSRTRRVLLDAASELVVRRWRAVDPADLESLLRGSDAGAALRRVGLGDDVAACAAVDACPAVGSWSRSDGIVRIG